MAQAGTALRLRAGGYQGPASVHTAGLRRLAAELAPEVELDTVEDVTAVGQTARSLFDGIESGAFDLGYMASGYITARVPELAVLDLPFAVADRHAAYAALDGETGKRLAEAVAARTGLRVLGYWDNGFRHLTNRARPIRTPADCAGLVVRTLDNQTYQDTMAAMGLTPVVTDVRELREAVATGRVDAQENPLTNSVVFELFRHHPYTSMTGHFFGIVLVVANAEKLDSLDPASRTRLEVAVRAATVEQRRRAEAEDTDALARLRAEGVEVLAPDAIDLAAFRAVTAPVSDKVLATLDPELVAGYCGPR